MTKMLHTLSNDKAILSGLVMFIVSLIGFLSTADVFETNFDVFTGTFFFNFGLTFLYFLMVFFQNKEDYGGFWRFKNFSRNIILLLLFNISAYSLNRSIAVFDLSANWVVWFLAISNGLLLLHALQKDYSLSRLNYVILILSNIGILFHFYESIYVMQGYWITVVSFWFFGISLHLLIPAFYTIANVMIVRRFLRSNPKFWTPTLLTWAGMLFFIGWFCGQFNAVNQTVNNEFHQKNKPFESAILPAWVETSKGLKKNWVTERALKSGLVYTSAKRIFSGFGNGRLNERRKHDPLVVAATFFSGNINIPTEDRIKILRSMFDARHQTERKLWSGENLSTSDIVTNVQLFPDFRLAYTEKTFKIVNNRITRWRSQQEALYTFYLPEGSVVTSASLWVNGEESPAFLTTKSKADSAYTTIVGRERRDPLLLHWQEGNQVTVRVFPCTPDEDRQFKIGVTTPLEKVEERLIYHNIDFEGPFWEGARESINVVTEGSLANFSAPYAFQEDGLNYSYSGSYQSDWTMEFDAPPLSNRAFSFNGKSYFLKDFKVEKTNFEATSVYLDINAGWSKSEVNSIWKAAKGKQVFVFSNGKMHRLNEGNRSALFRQLRGENFGLFPFYEIALDEKAIVVSKFNQLTPTLSDLKKSKFLEGVSTYFKTKESPVRVFNLGKEITPYLRTLAEIRAIQTVSGNADELIDFLKTNTFLKTGEDEKTIVNAFADFKIIETSDVASTTGGAPDHLKRLYAYNSILRDLGKDYFNLKLLADDLIQNAKEAYVVTPISSLIVLETQADYDRFDIKKSKNSLQNASFNNSGSVPEPKEWLLIILVFSMVVYFYFKK